ncbi:MAG: hypothetical protein QNJ30_02900 [Kiloniellales bacterium]|nr:hypothetical protein [Kiloniellales bacterium]
MFRFVGSALKALRDSKEHRKHRRALQEIEPGQAFVRARGARTLETVQVAGIVNLVDDVPHVRYRVRLRQQAGHFDDGVRTLGAAHFLETYSRVAEPRFQD